MKNGNICTIYLLTNTVNSKVYIGQTWLTLNKRMGKNGTNYKNSIYLYSAIQKYGSDKFQYEILAQCSDQKTADYLEDYYINQYDSRNHDIGYNIKEGGSVGKHSEETIDKISKTLKAQAAEWTPEERVKRTEQISCWWEGKERGPHTEEWKDNNSKMMIDRHATMGHPMQGQHHSTEAKSKISQASRGRKISPESAAQGAQKRKMPAEKEKNILQAYQEGMIIDEIEKTFQTKRSSIYRLLERNNIPLLNNFKKWTGRQHSEETKQKMSMARKEYWNNKN
jgi:group I intron endonuclease